MGHMSAAVPAALVRVIAGHKYRVESFYEPLPATLLLCPFAKHTEWTLTEMTDSHVNSDPVSIWLGCNSCLNPSNTEIFLYKPWRPKGFLTIISVLIIIVSSFRFICIPMLCSYGYTAIINMLFINYSSAGTVFRRRQMSVDVRLRRLKTVPALKGLTLYAGAVINQLRLNVLCLLERRMWFKNGKNN